MRTNIYWLFLDEVQDYSDYQDISENTLVPSIQQNYDSRFRLVDVLPTSNVVIGFMITNRWILFDVYKPYWNASVIYKQICFNNQDLVVSSNMQRALQRLDQYAKERRNLHGFAMPAGTAVIK